VKESHQKIILASGDGHVGARTHVYKDYLEKYLHPTFDEYYGRHKWRWSPSKPESYFPTSFHDKFVGSEGFDPAVGNAITWDADLRLKEYDRIGVTCEVLHPDDQNTNDPPFGSGLATGAVEGEEYPPELVRAGARAYNRWLADFCSADRDRLHGCILLGTLSDPVWCVEEIRRAYDSGLTTGVLLPLEYYEPLYHHTRYDIIWQTCAELGLAVNAHVSKGTPAFLGDDPYVERFMWFWEAVWFAQRPLWSLTMGGVLERFPDLHLNIAEIGVDWVNPLLEKLDRNLMMETGLPMNAAKGNPRRVPLSLRPSEYFARQCAVIHSAGPLKAELTGELYGDVPNMVWGGDVGHAEGIWPNTVGAEGDGLDPREAIAELVGGVPESKALAYLTDNFFKAYPNVDRAAQQKIADRIGRSRAELGVVAG